MKLVSNVIGVRNEGYEWCKSRMLDPTLAAIIKSKESLSESSCFVSYYKHSEIL